MFTHTRISVNALPKKRKRKRSKKRKRYKSVQNTQKVIVPKNIKMS